MRLTLNQAAERINAKHPGLDRRDCTLLIAAGLDSFISEHKQKPEAELQELTEKFVHNLLDEFLHTSTDKLKALALNLNKAMLNEQLRLDAGPNELEVWNHNGMRRFMNGMYELVPQPGTILAFTRDLYDYFNDSDSLVEAYHETQSGDGDPTWHPLDGVLQECKERGAAWTLEYIKSREKQGGKKLVVENPLLEMFPASEVFEYVLKKYKEEHLI